MRPDPSTLQPLRAEEALSAVSISSVKRFICHFLIVWLTLLSGGAHAIADARHEASHATVVVVGIQPAHASMGVPAAVIKAVESTEFDGTVDKAQSETCSHSHSHCGHGHTIGMLPTVHTCLTDASRDMVLALETPWLSGELPPTIERPKWSYTTPAVVNL